MKKPSTLALAALSAFAGTTSAQSSVTMFGVVDLSLRYVKNNEASYQLAQDGMVGSRLGFRGVEDGRRPESRLLDRRRARPRYRHRQRQLRQR